jgi:hypothetical protein
MIGRDSPLSVRTEESEFTATTSFPPSSFCGLQVTHMADMKKIKAAVGERDAFACSASSQQRERAVLHA